MKKIHYNKLIRDRIPDVMDENGAEYKVKKLNQKQFRKELLKKVGEEASALPNLKIKKDILKEIADVIAVIDEIKTEFNINEREIKNELKKAHNKKGGFNERLYLYWSSDTGYKTNERRYKKSEA